MTQTFHPWSRLPYELKVEIIERSLEGLWDPQTSQTETVSRVFRAGRAWFSNRSPHWSRWSDYATIDRVWQDVVEKHTFRYLAIQAKNDDGPDDIDKLYRICRGARIDRVSEIRLMIVLDNTQSWKPGSTAGRTTAATGPSSTSDSGEATTRDLIRAEGAAAKAFARLFHVLSRQGWSEKRQPLSLTYVFRGQRWTLRRDRLFAADPQRLRFDCSGLPNVTCIGSITVPDPSTEIASRDVHNTPSCEIHPASFFQLLAKLPSADFAKILFDNNLDQQTAVDAVQDAHSSPSFQQSKLTKLSLHSPVPWKEQNNPSLHVNPSLQRSQAIFSLTAGLEEITLYHTVDVPAFLRQASITKGSNTSQDNPAWPNLKKLAIKGFCGERLSDNSCFTADLHGAVTAALPHMPNLFQLTIVINSPVPFRGMMFFNKTFIVMRIPPRDDRSRMPPGTLRVSDPEPDDETLDEWRRIARSLWHCSLEAPMKRPLLQAEA